MRSSELTECDDAELVARAVVGDRAAFGELVRRHRRAALRLAAVIGGSTDEANDIVQDAFVSVHRALGSFAGSGSVRSWLLRVVANHAKNHLRHQTRVRRRDDHHAALQIREQPGAEDVVLRLLDQRALADALGRLGASDREVLGCRFVAELSEMETADVLGVAVGTVKSRTSRALNRLRAELDDMEATP